MTSSNNDNDDGDDDDGGDDDDDNTKTKHGWKHNGQNAPGTSRGETRPDEAQLTE